MQKCDYFQPNAEMSLGLALPGQSNGQSQSIDTSGVEADCCQHSLRYPGKHAEYTTRVAGLSNLSVGAVLLTPINPCKVLGGKKHTLGCIRSLFSKHRWDQCAG